MLNKDFGEDPCSTGNGLGQLTDEVEKDYGLGSEIFNFVCLGPKNYGYQLITKENKIITHIKVKGITLCQAAVESDGVTFENMENMAKEFQTHNTVKKFIKQKQIMANAKHELFTRQFVKEFKVVSKKRRLIGENKTVPYGWKKFPNDLALNCYEKEVYKLQQKFGYSQHTLTIAETCCRLDFKQTVSFIITQSIFNLRKTFCFEEEEILWVLMQLHIDKYDVTMYRPMF